MDLNFDQALECIVNNVVGVQEHEEFLNDVEIIAKKIFETMLEENFMFVEMFKELKTVAHRNDRKIDLPENFNITLMYELPFRVQPMFDQLNANLILLKTNSLHPIVREGFVDALRFDFLLTTQLENIIRKINETTDGSSDYLLSYNKLEIFDGTCRHNITAVQSCIDAAGKMYLKSIIFEFNIAFKFKFDDYPLPFCGEQFRSDLYWLAYPNPGLYADYRCMFFEMPFWQIIHNLEKIKLRHALMLTLTYDYDVDIVIFDIFILMYGFKLKIQAEGLCMLSGTLSFVFVEVMRLLAEMTKTQNPERYDEFTHKVELSLYIFQDYILKECAIMNELYSALTLK